MGIIRVALDPVETDGVALAQREKPLPQVGVEGRLLVRLDPPTGPPALGPALLYGVNDVLGVGVELHLTGLLQRLQGSDDASKLHPVVGGVGLPAGELLAELPVLQDGPPPPGAGIARAHPNGIDSVRFNK